MSLCATPRRRGRASWIECFVPTKTSVLANNLYHSSSAAPAMLFRLLRHLSCEFTISKYGRATHGHVYPVIAPLLATMRRLFGRKISLSLLGGVVIGKLVGDRTNNQALCWLLDDVFLFTDFGILYFVYGLLTRIHFWSAALIFWQI